MPVQTQISNLAAKLGGRLAAANALHKDAPIDTGFQRLPPGIDGGIAKLQVMTIGQYKDDKMGVGMKGKDFFRAAAVVMEPFEFMGRKVAGLQTSLIIPLCDVPSKGKREATTLEQNFFDFQNIFKMCRVAPCPETQQTDPTGQKTWAYFVAAMQSLTDPKRSGGSVYISFSTRGWVPPALPGQPPSKEMVFESWHERVEYKGKHNPAAGVTVAANVNGQPSPTDAPPSADGLPNVPSDARATSRPYNATGHTPPADEAADLVETVNALVDVAMADDGPDGVAASGKLEEMAWAVGWTREQTAGASDWREVGEMVLAEPTEPEDTEEGPVPEEDTTPAVGSVWMFARRDKSGNKLKDAKTKQELPPQEVQVVTVDEDKQTCTVKTVRDGKDVVDIRTRRSIAVKFEWLEE